MMFLAVPLNDQCYLTREEIFGNYNWAGAYNLEDELEYVFCFS